MSIELSRRNFLGLGAGLAFGGCCSCPLTGPKSVSEYNGVEIGAITYSYRSLPLDAASVLKYAQEDGLGTLELMGTVAEAYAGAPAVDRKKPETRAALAAWRREVGVKSMEKFRALRKMFEAGGVTLHIVKFGEIGEVTDEEHRYFFQVAKALGAGAITREIPNPRDYARVGERLGRMAEEEGVCVAFHNHTQIDFKTYDGPLLGYSKNFRINFDIGHYTAANDDDPLAFIEKYHDRIFSLHLKDRTRKANGAKNLMWGQGDTPLGPLFKFLQEKGYRYPCDIELEYAIPVGSDAVKEVRRCNRYARKLCGC